MKCNADILIACTVNHRGREVKQRRVRAWLGRPRPAAVGESAQPTSALLSR